MEQFDVTGMSCAACSARVEKAVFKVPGVTSCSVSLLTNSMGVEGTASDQDIIAAVVNAGYGAKKKGSLTREQGKEQEAEALEDKETPVLKKRLLWSVGFLAVLMYFSMGHMMWGWPLPAFMEGNHIAMGLTQLLLTVVIMVINQKFFVSGFKSLFHGAPNMDTLVALGATAAFGYSTFALYAMSAAQTAGDTEGVMHYRMEFYFESAAMILTLITVGKMLEARSKGKTTDALKSLMRLAPRNATLVRDDKAGAENRITETVPIEQVQIGDVFLVRPGENIPVDGVVLEGHSAVNEAALTGESVPVDKEEGSLVSAATTNQSGLLICRATRVGEDTTLSQIIQMVSDAAATKAPIAKVADKVSGIFVPSVIAIAIVTTLVWLFLGRSVGFAIARGISVLVISCPCALGLATPVAIMVGNGKGARNGILFKTAISLEETGKLKIVALDKTGTITAGEPQVTGIYPATGVTEEELLTLALNLEQGSEHPLAKAILRMAQKKQLLPEKVFDFQALAGSGVTAVWQGIRCSGGSLRYMQSQFPVPREMCEQADRISEEGQTPLLFARGEQILGLIAVADVLKEDSAEAVRQLKAMGLQVVMLTGDNERTAQAIGAKAGVDEVIAEVYPQEKAETVRRLGERGKVAMVGDGINDAPALTCADIGIAIGAGTDVAIDAADIVLMKSRLLDVPAAIRLSKATLKNIHENLFWAFFYNTIGIPLAAGVFIPLGLTLNPMFGAAAMSLSSFCVVSNALRLNFVDMNKAGKKKVRRTGWQESEASELIRLDELPQKDDEVKGEQTMKRTMKIKGMMCGHCEASVKKALEALPEVAEAVVSHEQGNAVVTLSAEISDEKLKEAVEAQDYKVTDIR